MFNPGLGSAPYKDADGYGLSHYAANSHILGAKRGVSAKDLDGHRSTTLLIGEVNANFKPWGPSGQLARPSAGHQPFDVRFRWRADASATNFALADGSVHFLNEHISPDVPRSRLAQGRGQGGSASA